MDEVSLMLRVYPVDSVYVVEEWWPDPITNEEVIKVFDEVFYTALDAYKFIEQLLNSDYYNDEYDY
jgi:hypothetical protein